MHCLAQGHLSEIQICVCVCVCVWACTCLCSYLLFPKKLAQNWLTNFPLRVTVISRYLDTKIKRLLLNIVIANDFLWKMYLSFLWKTQKRAQLYRFCSQTVYMWLLFTTGLNITQELVTVCHSWRMKDQLDVTCYFISLLMCPCCKLKPATWALLKTSHTKSPTHNKLRTRRLMW